MANSDESVVDLDPAMTASANERGMLNLPIATPNGTVARILLAFLATAGLFYVNIMPALVAGLIEGLGFSNKEAGLVGSSNVYGAALGALVAVFLIKRVRWKTAALVLLFGLICTDLVSIMVSDPITLIATRFVHGSIGGMLVGIGFAVIARTTEADRTFGYLLLIQFGLGGVGLMFLPPLVPEYGTAALFLSLVAFSSVTLLMLPFLSDYPVDETAARKHAALNNGIQVRPLVLSLLATFLFQAANMGLYAYIIGLGLNDGLEAEFINPTLASAAWVGIIGSGLVIVFSTRFGRTLPLTAAIILTMMGTWALHFSDIKTVYLLANFGVGITWAFVIPYLLGMCSEFDKTGQMAALGGFASKMGLASGPFVAALLVGESNYGLLINIAVVGLAAGLVAAVIPALKLDRARS